VAAERLRAAASGKQPGQASQDPKPMRAGLGGFDFQEPQFGLLFEPVTDVAFVGPRAGNPKRATARPTAELLLEAFSPVTLTVVVLPGRRYYHVSPLTGVQERILCLLGLAAEGHACLYIQQLPIGRRSKSQR
jgi:hypothetical protein